MRIKFRTLFTAIAVALAVAVSCEKPEPDNVCEVCGEEPCVCDTPDPDPKPEPEPGQEEGISNIVNSYAEKQVSHLGSTVSIKFDASAAWTASIELKTTPEEEWAELSKNTQGGEAKKGCTVRISIDQNETQEERVVELWVTAEGFDPKLVATITQASAGNSADAALNKALNTFMHEILAEDYLWNDAYNASDIDLTVSFTDFLPKHLLALGEVNVEDGGYYRASHSNAGERFIYSNIQEVQIVTKAGLTAGLGFGPFISTALAANSTEMALAPAYVRRGSPAEAAGLRRGDLIYAVNGTRLTTSNYRNYMTSLYANPSGEYTFSFLRFEQNGKGGYDLNAYDSGAAVAQAHVYDPILHASVLSDPENEAAKIGYLVYESFDLTSQDLLEETIDEFINIGITDLILDLRFNPGGAVSQSRWLSGCIVGEANWSKTFANIIFNDGTSQDWKFDYGYSNDSDNLGKPKDLKLDRLFVIGSYNTASAAELLINSLRGVDFPVKLIGCRTEGKNVGMNVAETKHNGRTFQFSPVTFWVRNAKDVGDYSDGFIPDEYVNNDNTLMTDDADNVFPYSFSDWGNMDYNIALQWAYCDITGKDRWTHTPGTKSSSAVHLMPEDFQQMETSFGRYGNLIYDNK